MYTEVPVLNRCCCCLPLRYGLIGWGYLKVIMSVLSLLYFFTALLYLVRAVNYHLYQDLAIVAIIALMLIVDITLNIVFLVGAHKKKVTLLEAYYYYSFIILILLSLLTFVFVGKMIGNGFYYYHSIIGTIGRAAILILNLVFQAYLVLLVRSEIIKLKDSASCKFVNNAADAECVLNVKETNEEKAASFDYNPQDLSKDNYGIVNKQQLYNDTV